MVVANISVIHYVYSEFVGDKRTRSLVGFSKFEEKKRQQAEKKTKLPKLTVFRKSSSSKGILFSLFSVYYVWSFLSDP